MEITSAKLRDSKILSDIDKIAHSELEGWSPNNKSDFIRIIKNKKQQIFVARDAKEIIGYVSIRKDKESKWLWIEDLYVIKSHRNKGIAKLLIKYVINHGKKKLPKRRIVLLTADRNLEIFNKLGFKKTMNFMQYSN